MGMEIRTGEVRRMSSCPAAKGGLCTPDVVGSRLARVSGCNAAQADFDQLEHWSQFDWRYEIEDIRVPDT
jgi:hypothetical protein